MEKTRFDDLLAELNPAQRKAVTHVDGALMVLAGPGSGQTRVTVIVADCGEVTDKSK